MVVTHESADLVIRCLESIPGGTARPHQVIVVDNASSDGTADLVATRFPSAVLVRSPRRRGFAANCNAGAAVATGDVLFLLNPDTEVRAGALDVVVDRLLDDPGVGIVGPRLVYPDGSFQPSARRFPTVGATLVRRTPLRWLLPDSGAERRHLMGGDSPASASDVDWLLGAALAIRASDYRRLGGMDGGFRLYCEDIDLCWRSWEAGLRVVLEPAATVVHDLSELTRRRFLARETLWHLRSMARFVRKHPARAPRSRRPGHT